MSHFELLIMLKGSLTQLKIYYYQQKNVAENYLLELMPDFLKNMHETNLRIFEARSFYNVQ